MSEVLVPIVLPAGRLLPQAVPRSLPASLSGLLHLWQHRFMSLGAARAGFFYQQ
jgi:hypothetical protein